MLKVPLDGSAPALERPEPCLEKDSPVLPSIGSLERDLRTLRSPVGHSRRFRHVGCESASLIGRLGSSTFRLSTTAVSMSLTGSRFSSESAPRPFQYGIRGRGGTIFTSALPSVEQQDQADSRTHLIHRPARDIFPRRVEL